MTFYINFRHRQDLLENRKLVERRRKQIYRERRDFNKCMKKGQDFLVGRGAGDRVYYGERKLTDADLEMKEDHYNTGVYKKELEAVSLAAQGEPKTKVTAREFKNKEIKAKKSKEIETFLKR